MKNCKRRYIKYVNTNTVDKFFRLAKQSGADITYVGCNKEYMIVTYYNDFEIKGDLNEV